MAASLSLRAFTGTNAATESASLTAIRLTSDDDVVTNSSVDPGTNSYERWLRLRLDDPDGHIVSDFWVELTGSLPDGVTIKFGAADDPATPTTSASAIATTEMVAGRRYIFDAGSYDTAGDHTRYLVLQEQVAADADSGAIPQGSIEFGWLES